MVRSKIKILSCSEPISHLTVTASLSRYGLFTVYHDYPPEEKNYFFRGSPRFGYKKSAQHGAAHRKTQALIAATQVQHTQRSMPKRSPHFYQKAKMHTSSAYINMNLCRKAIVSSVYAESKGDLREIRAKPQYAEKKTL